MSSASVLFGCTSPYGLSVADNTCCAINASRVFVEVHEVDGKLYYGCGTVDGVRMLVRQKAGAIGSDGPDSGHDPRVVVDNAGHVLEVHASGGTGSDLWYWLGTVASDGSSVTWSKHAKFPSSSGGHTPSLALNRNGIVVEVHVNDTSIVAQPFGQSMYWWLGTFKGGAVTWVKNGSLNDSGYDPKVAVNNAGVVVSVHSDGGTGLWYTLGKVTFDGSEATGIRWTSASTRYDTGSVPSVAITDDDLVIETHQSQLSGPQLWTRIGKITYDAAKNPVSITWSDTLGQGRESYQFDTGSRPHVATNAVLTGGSSTNTIALATRLPVPSGNAPTWWAGTASLIFDRSAWIGDNLATLGKLQLRELVFPGSHDAGMYVYGLAQDFAKTQDLDIGGQLRAGVRWFDLRPMLDGGAWYIDHGGVKGPPLLDVLTQVKGFLASGRELVLLKLSHYSVSGRDFAQSDLDALCAFVRSALAGKLYTALTAQDTRLGIQTVSALTASFGNALVLCDGDAGLVVDTVKNPGIFNYRDWNNADAGRGNLTMFDLYSQTTAITTMISGLGQDPYVSGIAMPRGQKPKFEGGTVPDWSGPGSATWGGFDGTCMTPNTDVPCDLFLLSWTLTPEPNSVWSGAAQADACLADDVTSKGPNANGRQINVLYTDYVEYSRSADVAYLLNGLGSA